MCVTKPHFDLTKHVPDLDAIGLLMQHCLAHLHFQEIKIQMDQVGNLLLQLPLCYRHTSSLQQESNQLALSCQVFKRFMNNHAPRQKQCPHASLLQRPCFFQITTYTKPRLLHKRLTTTQGGKTHTMRFTYFIFVLFYAPLA